MNTHETVTTVTPEVELLSPQAEAVLEREARRMEGRTATDEKVAQRIERMRSSVQQYFAENPYTPRYLNVLLRIALADMPARIAAADEEEVRNGLIGQISDGLEETKSTDELRTMAAAY